MAAAFSSGSRTRKGWRVDVDRLRHILQTHCCVMHGHLVAAYWPRFKRRTGEHQRNSLCTCGEYGMHAECQHAYAAALNGGPHPIGSVEPGLWAECSMVCRTSGGSVLCCACCVFPSVPGHRWRAFLVWIAHVSSGVLRMTVGATSLAAALLVVP